jgi:hypothetical protein
MKIIKSRRSIWLEHISHITEKRNSYKIASRPEDVNGINMT